MSGPLATSMGFHITPGPRPVAPPLPDLGPAPGTDRVATVRAQVPGGQALSYVQSDKLLWFERVYRKLPPKGTFSATPSKPLTFTMGSFRVPKNQVLVVTDYSFNIYRFSGASPGDYLPIEENRLSTQVGWDITVDGSRQADLSYELIPSVETQSAAAFPIASTSDDPAQDYQFEQVRQMQNQGAVPAYGSLMPQRIVRPGRTPVANNYVAQTNSNLNVSCSIIRKIPIPIAFFEATLSGMLMPQSIYIQYQKGIIPFGVPIVNYPTDTP